MDEYTVFNLEISVNMKRSSCEYKEQLRDEKN